jgi:hypothetical protein
MIGACSCRLESVSVRYPGRRPPGGRRASSGPGGGRDRRADRPLGLRQDLAAARGRRARALQHRAHRDRRQTLDDADAGCTWRRRTAASAWCSRTTRSSRTSAWPTTWPSAASLPRAERAERVQQMLDLVGLAHAAQARPAPALGRPAAAHRAGARAGAPGRGCCCSTSPSPASTSTCASTWRRRCVRSSRTAAPRRCSSPTTSWRPSRSATSIGVMNRAGSSSGTTPTRSTTGRRRASWRSFIGHGVFTPAQIVACAHGPCVHTPLGELDDMAGCPLPEAFPDGQCDVLLRADDIVHDDASPVKARIERKAFRGSEFLYTLRLASGEQVLAHVPSHHDHQVGEWIGIRPAVDHVVTFPREPPAARGSPPETRPGGAGAKWHARRAAQALTRLAGSNALGLGYTTGSILGWRVRFCWRPADMSGKLKSRAGGGGRVRRRADHDAVAGGGAQLACRRCRWKNCSNSRPCSAWSRASTSSRSTRRSSSPTPFPAWWPASTRTRSTSTRRASRNSARAPAASSSASASR